ncbi:hypothetical protein C8R47DRAFT_100995 [Mycena vitilis]|nr:hypothetical protein C8R47DRAFT_100995 [Mycena vitilis]
MPTSPFVQNARSCALDIRWLCTLLRERIERLPSALRFVLDALLRFQNIVRGFCPSYPRNHNANTNQPGFLPYHDQLQRTGSQVLPSRHPAPLERKVDSIVGADPAVFKNETLDGAGSSATPDARLSTASSTASPMVLAIDRQASPQSGCQSGSTPRTSPQPENVSSAILDIRPIFPENFGRYQRTTIPREQREHSIKPETLTFAANNALPPGWIPHLHPEGARYFSHADRRIFTDINLHDNGNFKNFNEVVDQIITIIRPACDEANSTEADPHYAALLGEVSSAANMLADLVIDAIPNESGAWGYYFVNHAERCPFWLHPTDADYLGVWNSIEGTIEKEQLRHAMENQYWQHCALFPDALQLTERHASELEEYLVYAIGDVSTALTSTVSTAITELKDWLSLVRHMKGGLGSTYTFGETIASPRIRRTQRGFSVARIMGQSAMDRFHNFHGLPHARLSVDQSVYENAPLPSRLFRAASIFLFFAPEVYLRSLDKAYTDRMVLTRIWKPLIEKLNTEWQDFVLLATVVLNANVSFLSINSVDIPPDDRRSIVQILSYLSVVGSIGAMTLGLLLVRQNRTKFHESAAEISSSVHRRTSKLFGLELLALIFALPYALLMWSMLFFFGALVAASLRAHDTVARSVIGVAACIMVLLVCWCIWDAWDMQDADQAPFGYGLRQRIRSALHSVLNLARANADGPLLGKETKRRGSSIQRLLSRRSEKKESVGSV